MNTLWSWYWQYYWARDAWGADGWGGLERYAAVKGLFWCSAAAGLLTHQCPETRVWCICQITWTSDLWQEKAFMLLENVPGPLGVLAPSLKGSFCINLPLSLRVAPPWFSVRHLFKGILPQPCNELRSVTGLFAHILLISSSGFLLFIHHLFVPLPNRT